MSAQTPSRLNLSTAPIPALPISPTVAQPSSDHRDVVLPCHIHPPDLWFAQDPAGVEAAKSLCGPCPLRTACLEGALARAEPWGVWGGECVLDGVAVKRKRGRGRPRKDTNTA